MRKIVIDGEIVFFPDQKKLSSLKNDKSVFMFSTGARCLEYLIDNQGVIVSQKTLIPVCWSEENALKTVSQAAYYQCLVDLRRNIKDIGYNKTLISTVRGQGIRINPDIDIIIKMTSAMEKKNDVEPVMEENTRQNKITKKTTLLMIFIMIIITSIFYTYIKGRGRQIKSSMQDTYHTLIGYPQCYYFNDNNVDNKLITNFLQGKGFTCETKNLYYISHFSAAPRLTIFSCSDNQPLVCESLTFLGDFS